MAGAKATAAIVDLVAQADERRTYALFTLWSRHTTPEGIHAALRGGALAGRLAAVRHFAETWADVAPVAFDDDVRIRFAVRRAFQQRLKVVPLDALARWIDDAVEQHGSLAYLVLDRLRHGERLPPGTNVLARARRRLAALPPILRPRSEETALARLDEDDEDSYDERACLTTLIKFVEAQN